LPICDFRLGGGIMLPIRRGYHPRKTERNLR
jgi:hypothetical protein